MVYKLFKRMFSYTRVNAKLGFGKTSFMNTPEITQLCFAMILQD